MAKVPLFFRTSTFGALPSGGVLSVGVLDDNKNLSLLRQKPGAWMPSKLNSAVPDMGDGLYGKSMSQAFLSLICLLSH